MEYLITSHLPEMRKSEQVLASIIDRYGPVVQAYPYWHPLVASSKRDPEVVTHPQTLPGQGSGYHGLDHTIYLKNGFITCPYADRKAIFDSVKKLKVHPSANIEAESLDVKLYHPNALPVLVKCKWDFSMETDGTIPKRVAVPLYLEKEIPNWWRAKFAESWETMRPYILGSPRGSRSSLFVNQDTGHTLKTIHNMLINTGMFGPIYGA